MQFSEFRNRTYETIELTQEYTVDEFVKMVKKTFSTYTIKAVKTKEELILLYLYKDWDNLSHTQVFELNQFKK